MADPVTITLLGEPVPWARAAGGRTRGLFTPTKQRNNAAALRMAAQNAMAGRTLFDEPIVVWLTAEFAIPASWSKKKQILARNNELRPGKRPDLSNCLKQVEDALNAVVFRDDCLIVEAHLAKRYSDQPKVVITVRNA